MQTLIPSIALAFSPPVYDKRVFQIGSCYASKLDKTGYASNGEKFTINGMRLNPIHFVCHRHDSCLHSLLVPHYSLTKEIKDCPCYLLDPVMAIALSAARGDITVSNVNFSVGLLIHQNNWLCLHEVTRSPPGRPHYFM